MAVAIGLTTACTVSGADVPASGGLSQNYFAVTSTIPIFDSSGEYLTPVMINPGLHLQAYTLGEGVESKVGPMINCIRSPLLPLNARVLANCRVISAPVTSVGLILCSVIVRNTTASVFIKNLVLETDN